MTAPGPVPDGPPVPVHRFGTGLIHTTVVGNRDDEAWSWTRRPGPHAPTPFAVPRPVPEANVPARPGAPALVFGGSVPDVPGARRYRMPAAESVAARLLRDGADADLVPALQAAGTLLRGLHDDPFAPVATGPARPVRRMRSWFAGRAPRADAVRAGRLLRARIGASRWTALGRWAGTVGPGGQVALHGAPGLGAMAVCPETGAVSMLAGEDVATGPRSHDLGWLLGELVELRWYCGGPVEAWTALADAVVDGYGAAPGADVHRRIALRTALHLHDYSAYVGWNPVELERYAPLLAALVDG